MRLLVVIVMDGSFLRAEQTLRVNFIRELVERLSDGCSVTFTVPRDVGIEVAHQVLHDLREQRGCLTVYIDLHPIKSVEEFADALTRTYLELITGDIDSLSKANDSVLEKLSQSEGEEKIRDVIDVTDLDVLSAWEKVDWAVELAELIGTRNNTRLVVWFHEWQEIARMKDGDLLLKRLRGMFQLQTHVTYAFTGSRDPDLMRKFFADYDQPFYRFAVELQLPE